MPGQPPEIFRPRALRVGGPGLEIPKMDCVRDGDAEHGQVLHVLSQDDWSGFQDEDAMAMRFVSGKEMLRKRRAEGAPADDDDVEGASIRTKALVGAPLGLVQAITDVAAQDITAEVSRLRERGRGHEILLPHGDALRRA